MESSSSEEFGSFSFGEESFSLVASSSWNIFSWVDSLSLSVSLSSTSGELSEETSSSFLCRFVGGSSLIG